MDFSEVASRGVDKVSRYGWKIADQPGELAWLDKNVIKVDELYQRSLVNGRVTSLSQNWSWIACGALIIAKRENSYWAIDGQHRLMAAKRRSDITEIPCLVFQVSNIQEEAKGFIAVNSERKPISTKQQHKAKVVSGDETAKKVQAKIDELGLTTTTDSKTPGHFACFAWAMKTAKEDYDLFSTVLKVTAEICLKDGEPVKHKLVQGFTYLHKNYTGGILEPRMHDRIKAKGSLTLDIAATKSAIMMAQGGSKVWARGILEELNKGLVKKFRVNGIGDS